MRFATTLCFALFAAIALAGPCRADDVLLVDGSVYAGTVDKVEKDGITLTIETSGGGTATFKMPAARLDPVYFYDLLDGAAAKDAKAHVQLAVWAVEQGLFSRARLQMRRAEKLDPEYVRGLKEGEFPELREGIATQILASAEGDTKAGRLDVAEQKLELLLLRLPDTQAGGKARESLQALQPLIETRDAKQADAERQKLAETERKAADERAKKFAKFDAEIVPLKKLAVQGLVEDSDQKSLDLLGTALARAKARLEELDAMTKDAGADPEFAKEADARRRRIQAGMVKVYLHRTDIYVYRGNVKDAVREVEGAKAIDPNNPDVAAAMLRAQNADDGYLDISEQRWRRARLSGGGGRFSGGGRR